MPSSIAEIFKESIWLLIKTLPVVIEVLVFGVIFSYAWGLILALIRLSRFKTLRWLAGAYIDFFRGLPLLLLFIFIYSGLAIAGLKLTSLMSAVLGFDPLLRRLFGGDLPGRHPGHTEGSDGGRPVPGHDHGADHALRRSSPRPSSW